MQWLLAGLGVSAFLLVLFTFPETAHARGIDQVKELRAQTRAAKAPEPTSNDVEKSELGPEAEVVPAVGGSWIRRKSDNFAWVWLNPLAPIRLLLHPNIAAMVRLSPRHGRQIADSGYRR